MAFCRVCGNEMHDSAIVCTKCGVATANYGNGNINGNINNQNTQIVDTGGFGWGLLGCCIPMVGLILFLIWKDERPNTAKSAGIGALVAAILMVLYFVAVFGLAIVSEMSYY